MSGSLEGTVAIVTGAGSGLGRAEALALAGAGASVVVGDLDESAKGVVDEIADADGTARFVPGDVGERDTADALTAAAVEEFGGLHILVNNAGITRDRMLFNATDAEWDEVIRVHLRGHFLLSRNAASYWRGKSKSDGAPVYGSVVNTTSEAFLLGSEGQPNYAAAKAGIAALTTATARGMARYGVRANAICPRARTAMTSDVFGPAPESGIDPLSVDHVTPLVTYLASAESERISGQVFVVHGGMVALMAPPTVEARFDAAEGQWSPSELAEQVGGYFDGRAADRMFAATEVMDLP